eukprot:TRINITY_DN1220_c0_g1_i1.p1 TRINITY_DN1220_c0_g1~~TRINITY_DN1220_c0_g1_i1.p1  ORF type:complete len:528 (+),score=33.43 TRINITY_DN1220_c0_g1_i1:215-1798(+)
MDNGQAGDGIALSHATDDCISDTSLSELLSCAEEGLLIKHSLPRRYLRTSTQVSRVVSWETNDVDLFRTMTHLSPRAFRSVLDATGLPYCDLLYFQLRYGHNTRSRRAALEVNRGEGTMYNILRQLSAQQAAFDFPWASDILDHVCLAIRRYEVPASFVMDGTLINCHGLGHTLGAKHRKGYGTNNQILASFDETVAHFGGGFPGMCSDMNLHAATYRDIMDTTGSTTEHLRDFYSSALSALHAKLTSYRDLIASYASRRISELPGDHFERETAVPRLRAFGHHIRDMAFDLDHSLLLLASADDDKIREVFTTTRKTWASRLNVKKTGAISPSADDRARRREYMHLWLDGDPCVEGFLYGGLWALTDSGYHSSDITIKHPLQWRRNEKSDDYLRMMVLGFLQAGTSRADALYVVEKYNHWLSRSRVLVERVVRWVKRRHASLHLLYTRRFEVAAQVFMSAVVVHNIAIRADYDAPRLPTPSERAHASAQVDYVRAFGMFRYWVALGAPGCGDFPRSLSPVPPLPVVP